jgi:L-seryl-tRNA(Ser) seleniumtransferase
MTEPAAGRNPVDRFGNPIDESVGYARGRILASNADEIARTMYARSVVRERVRAMGEESVFDLSGLPRSFPLAPEDLSKLRSQATYYAYVDGSGEELAVRFMGGDPAVHDALFVTRVTAGLLAVALALLRKGDAVVSMVPKGRSHPSLQRSVELAGGDFFDVVGLDDFEQALERLRPRMAVVTPVTAAKHHLPVPDLVKFVELTRREGAISLLDDAHMASRIGFYGDPLPFQSAPADLAVLSTDKHIAGPRAGVVVGRKDLVQRVRSSAMEFGLEAPPGHYAAACRALQQHRMEPLREAGELARELFALLGERYGGNRFYMAGPGVAISGEDALMLALERSGKPSPAAAPMEAATIVTNHMLIEHGIITITSFSMPGTAPVVRLMMFPDGARLGIDRIAMALESGLSRLQEVLDRPEAARETILGPALSGRA